MSAEEYNQRFRPDYPLTPLQFAFCAAYAVHSNGMKAIREAGYKHSTPGSQSSAAHRLLQLDRIVDCIAFLRAD